MISNALAGQVPLLSNLKGRFGKFFKICRWHKIRWLNLMLLYLLQMVWRNDQKGDECIITYELGRYSSGDDNRNI